MTEDKTIYIHPLARRNRLFLMTVGSLLLGFCLLLDLLFWQAYKLQLIILNMAALIVFLVGYLKHLQPKVSYTITPEWLSYHHSWGQWRLPWHSIRRVGEINVQLHMQALHLPFVGIALSDVSHLANSISPRLANKLIHEQKNLLITAVKAELITQQQAIICFEPFRINGQRITGPIAAFLHQCTVLQSAYGFHLYLPQDSFDRELPSFIALLQQCQRYSSTKA
ncbi:DUF2982 domain-containing protein [Thalassotalea sp. HSM 43]|uniref:DUF2982 domain-containing protein n=1 Tax=Thalassotalea sp. HSM 43 TaxID=2552945 RepID=UPI0010805692|nr:DUF2982 domain-containing protein [Thalassotalea sp. HSM 43]QBY02889.1 DUF2982 domain-containing protein [Thalassotalea sp. HSM 43]